METVYGGGLIGLVVLIILVVVLLRIIWMLIAKDNMNADDATIKL